LEATSAILALGRCESSALASYAHDRFIRQPDTGGRRQGKKQRMRAIFGFVFSLDASKEFGLSKGNVPLADMVAQ